MYSYLFLLSIDHIALICHFRCFWCSSKCFWIHFRSNNDDKKQDEPGGRAINEHWSMFLEIIQMEFQLIAHMSRSWLWYPFWAKTDVLAKSNLENVKLWVGVYYTILVVVSLLLENRRVLISLYFIWVDFPSLHAILLLFLLFGIL